MTLTATATASSSVSDSLIPGDQERDWKRRWRLIQDRLNHLLAARSEPRSAKAIHDAAQELLAFYIQAYHFKDALIAESVTTGIQKGVIESAINSNPDLALLADLANLEKHTELIKKPRSGHYPKVASIRDTSLGLKSWRLVLTIEHGAKQLDGLRAAQDAIEAWRRLLTHWNLI